MAQAPTPTITPLFPSLSSAHRAFPSASLPPLTAQIPAPAIHPLSPSLSSAHRAFPSASMPPIAAPAATFFPPLARPSFSPSSAIPLPIPPNALALEPPSPRSQQHQDTNFLEDQTVGTRGGTTLNPLLLNIQPHQTLLPYMHYRSPQAKLPSDLLLLMTLKHPATWFWFQKHLKSILQPSGIPLLQPLLPPASQPQIQALGHWTSEAFKTYIWSDHSHIKEAHQTLISRPL